MLAGVFEVRAKGPNSSIGPSSVLAVYYLTVPNECQLQNI